MSRQMGWPDLVHGCPGVVLQEEPHEPERNPWGYDRFLIEFEATDDNSGRPKSAESPTYSDANP